MAGGSGAKTFCCCDLDLNHLGSHVCIATADSPHEEHVVWPRHTAIEPSYRVGRSLGRTIYFEDELIGIMDDPEDAALIVKLLNDDNKE